MNYYPRSYEWENVCSQGWSLLCEITQLASNRIRFWSLEGLSPKPNFRGVGGSPNNKTAFVCFRCPRSSYFLGAFLFTVPWFFVPTVSPNSLSQRDYWSFPRVWKPFSLIVNSFQVCLSYVLYLFRVLFSILRASNNPWPTVGPLAKDSCWELFGHWFLLLHKLAPSASKHSYCVLLESSLSQSHLFSSCQHMFQLMRV